MMKSIYGYAEKDLIDYFTSIGEKPFRAKQTIEWLYRHKIRSFDEMTNVKKAVIENLNNNFNLDLFQFRKDKYLKMVLKNIYLD